VVAKLNICVHHLKNQLAFGILGRSTVAKLLKVRLKLKWDIVQRRKAGNISGRIFFTDSVELEAQLFFNNSLLCE
jgi:hypothetical protein